MTYEPTEAEIEEALAEEEQRHADYWDGGSEYWQARLADEDDCEPSLTDGLPYDPAQIDRAWSENWRIGARTLLCTVCKQRLGLRDHDGIDHVDCAAGNVPVAGPEFAHIVGSAEALLSWLRRKAPVALCGASQEGNRDPGPDAPVCPDCRLQSVIRAIRPVARSQHTRRLRADRQKWAQARSIADIGELTAQWLEGGILHQPGYCDPDPGETGPDEETRRIAPLLAACCHAGYVTTCSQPATTDWSDGTPNQRAAVEGFCDLATYVRLAELAREAGGLLVIAHDPATPPRRRLRFKGECCRWCTRLPGSAPVTRSQGSDETWFGARRSRRDLRDIHVGYGECHRDAVREITRAWQVTLIELEWGKNERLFQMLERFTGVRP